MKLSIAIILGLVLTAWAWTARGAELTRERLANAGRELLGDMPPYKLDRESPMEREERMGVLSDAMAIATWERAYQADGLARWKSSPDRLYAALLTQGWFESRFAWHIHAGHCRAFECGATRDDGGLLVFLTPTPWQVAESTAFARALWPNVVGQSAKATTNAARVAAYHLAMHQCGGDVAQMLQAQGGGGCHHGERGWERFRYWQRTLVKLRKLMRGAK